MSIKDKLNFHKNRLLEELNKKDRELRDLKSELDYLIRQIHNEIKSKTEELSNGFQQLADDRERFDRHIDDVIGYFKELEKYGKDTKIVDAYINACFILDGRLVKYFKDKPRPAETLSQEIKQKYKFENKELLLRIKELESQIAELWAKDIDTSEKEDFERIEDDESRAKSFLSPTDILTTRSESERNQRALDNYLKRNHSKSYIGKMYERYIGYIYEKEHYEVEYRGIEMGLKDGGIDLICRKNGLILLVQCKCWKQESTIYEKHICQLYGASRYYDKDHIQAEYKDGLFANVEWERVTPVFVCTNQLDDHAKEVAKKLGVSVSHIPLRKDYPMIKCNINSAGERIYHLPFDQMYDKTKICKTEEFWAYTVKEAENKGFRRAKRHLFIT